MNLVEAVRRYKAQLKNPRWSVSAFSEDGSLVVCLWEHLLKRVADPDTGDSTLQYQDRLSSWAGNRNHGAKEFKGHLERVVAEGTLLRLVITHARRPADHALVGQVADESAIPKEFSVREDLVGEVARFDGDELRLVFRIRS
jgi:hypothetical protein